MALLVYCYNCGGKGVKEKRWVNLNTGVTESAKGYEDAFCEDCQEFVPVLAEQRKSPLDISFKDYLEKINKKLLIYLGEEYEDFDARNDLFLESYSKGFSVKKAVKKELKKIPDAVK